MQEQRVAVLHPKDRMGDCQEVLRVCRGLKLPLFSFHLFHQCFYLRKSPRQDQDKLSFWQRLFGKKNSEQCKICINDWDKELALEILKKFEKDIENQGEMLSVRTESSLKDTYVHK